MNEQLKFSWGHIVAFLALVFIAYVTFVGATYYNDGDFAVAGVTTTVVMVLLFVVFLGVQMAKATSQRFSKRIWIERAFVFMSPVALLVCMMPFYHFGVVNSQADEILGAFNENINSSKKMFSDYEEYSVERIANYTAILDSTLSEGNGSVQIQRQNMIESLRLQLLSDNYKNLKSSAIQWIDGASEGASVWNVFLLGNTKEIKAAIHEWADTLNGFSQHKMVNEELDGYNNVQTFSDAEKTVENIDAGFNALTKMYTRPSFPPLWAILVSLLLYGALSLPYLIQDRHTKSTYTLCGRRYVSKGNTVDIDLSWADGDGSVSNSDGKPTSNNNNDFGSFTM